MESSKGLCMGCMSEIGEEQICPVCGYDNSSADNGNGLPVRTLLGDKYIIGRVLDSGGEGITYIGKDAESGKTVRIREFFPNDICSRSEDGTVAVKKEFSFSFNESLICFLDLAKSLSALNGNPHLLDVIDVFEAGGTAYYVTDSVAGITLREFLLRNGGQLTWEQARALFLPLLPVLTRLHEANIIHRGISPETLLVGRDGKVRITGFCIAAARTARSDISARLFPGFAAIEQYGFDAKSGPWTDVYGVAATLFRTLVGNPPPEATERVSSDNMTIPSKLVESIPKNVLSALAGALQVMPENRTKTIEKFREGLISEPEVAVAKSGEKADGEGNTFFKQYGVLIAAISATVLLLIIALVIGKNWKAIFGAVTGNGDSIAVPTSSEYVINAENEVAKIIDFKGMTCAEIEEYYEKQGFEDIETEVVGKSYQNDYKRGEVYKQKRKVGVEIQAGEKIAVYVSLGPEQVSLPDFVGEKTTYTEARMKLLEMGFLPENITEVAVTKLGEDSGTVFAMSPEGGTKVSPESKVELSYYKEIENITVDSFVGKNYYTEIKGSNAYSAYQFVIEETYSEVYEQGVVIQQSVPRGTKIKNTETVTLTISKGEPPAMPDLRGRLKSDAVNLLSKRGIAYTIIEQYDSTIASGRVIRTTPGAGTTVSTTVTIYISKGARPVSSAPSVASSTVSSTESGTESGDTQSTYHQNNSSTASTTSANTNQ